MNSLQRMTQRLQGAPVDRPPNFNIYMTFAAHYIHEPLYRFYLDYRVLAEANRAMVTDFAVDLFQSLSDPYRETADFGAQIEFPPDGLPVCRQPLLADPQDLRRLPKPDPAASLRMLDRLQAVRLMCQWGGDEIPVMGWVEGALAEAGDLRGSSSLLLDVYDRPEWLEELLERCVEVAIEFARLQIEAGARIIGLGDAIASQIAPAMYRRFALPYEQRIFSAVHAMGALARLHICGNTTRLLPDMVASGADIIDLDWMVDLESAASRYGQQAAFCGNFNPVGVILQGSPAEVYAAARYCVQAGGPRGFSAAGCEIPDQTPPENLRAHLRALQDVFIS